MHDTDVYSQLTSKTTVQITRVGVGLENGDIKVNTGVVITNAGTGTRSLVLTADPLAGSINVNGNAKLGDGTNNPLNVTMTAFGGIALNGTSSINTLGGNVVATTTTGNVTQASGSSITAGAGAVTLTGTAGQVTMDGTISSGGLL